ncbi:hypothetical protein GH714_000190 [Hevea brasiliensis]|uniref:MULE transposase domain-containing protein n=1 Tax=Hevea brasiliensis TaxID=3981 RepID=A0A6A6M4X6_HEVBR|nr:hypothetical protein GH714_000190 [Hevea brasiliensis]
MQPKRKGVVLEEIDEDLGNAILENNSSSHYLTDQQFEREEGSGIARRNLIELGHYGVDDASPGEVDIGNNGVDVRGNEVESYRLNKVEGEYIVGHGNYGGQLLTAVGIDPNDYIFPIPYAVVLIENKDNWQWFLEQLKEDLQIYNSHRWAFMSDRQKGLIAVIGAMFPNSEHRLCVRHMYTNFRCNFKGKELKDMLWNVARSSYKQKLDYWLNKIEEKNPEAREWLREKPSDIYWILGIKQS